jgi:hypothetical protein
MAGKGHFGGTGQQAAVAAVVVGQQLALGAQALTAFTRRPGLRVVQVGHRAAGLAQHLRQHGAAHAVLPLAQVDQHQRGVVFLASSCGVSVPRTSARWQRR